MTDLTEHFTLEELIYSNTALRLGIDNTPKEEYINNLTLLAKECLEPIRSHFGPVHINSGYRSLALNMVINPMTSTITTVSKHCFGQAADVRVHGISNVDLAIWCRDTLPEFEQVILEFYTQGQPYSGWVHIAYVVGDQRKQSLTATRINGKVTYLEGIQA